MRRVRRLFFAFALGVFLLNSVGVVLDDTQSEAAKAVALMLHAGLGAWATLLVRQRIRLLAGDLWAAGSIVGIGVVLGTGEWAYFPMIMGIFLRSLHGGGRGVFLAAVLYFAGFDAAMAVTHGAQALLSAEAFTYRIGGAFTAWVMWSLGQMLAGYDRKLAYDALLGSVSNEFVASETRESVIQTTGCALGALVQGRSGRTAALWLQEGGHIEERVVVGGGEAPAERVAASDVDALPEWALQAYSRGELFRVGPDQTADIRRALGLPPTNVHSVAAPIQHIGRVVGALVLSDARRPDDEIDDALARLAVTVGLALDRAHASERFRGVVDSLWDTIMIVDRAGRITFASPATRRLLGRGGDEVVGALITDLTDPTSLDAQSLLEHEPGAPLECRIAAVDGAWRTVEIAANVLTDETGEEQRVLAIRDISDRKALEEEIAHQAFHDAVTGLPNRTLFTDRVEHALARARRHGQHSAIAFVDLDDFKTVNDSLGHESGDALLRDIGARLQHALRDADTVARLGGDEFGLLLEDLDAPDEAEALCQRALDALGAPFSVDGAPVTVQASAGVVVSDGHDDVAGLLRDADLAMYAAKARGKARVAMFEPALHEAVLRKHELRADLRRAFHEGQFSLVYQPVVDLRRSRVIGAEALLRWRHPERGFIPPLEFIPLAEEDGLIVPLGRWVIDEALRQLSQWNAAYPESPPLTIGVNLSAIQFADPGLVPFVEEAVAKHGIAPRQFVLEVTETAVMRDLEQANQVLTALRDLGVRTAVDDFGNGYSSLSYLRDLPMDFLKIDRSFINGIDESRSQQSLTRAVIRLAENLGLQPIAEGVERPTQWSLLRRWGCGHAQGYLFARPLPPEELVRVLGDRAIDVTTEEATAASPVSSPQ